MMTKIHGGKNLPLRREKATLSIEAKANEVRARFATPGKHTIYDRKYQEAVRYISAVQGGEVPSDLADYPYIAREVQLTAPTPFELAQLWIGMNMAWEQVSPLIEEISLRGKYAMKAAQSQDEIERIAVSAMEELDSIGEPSPLEIQGKV